MQKIQIPEKQVLGAEMRALGAGEASSCLSGFGKSHATRPTKIDGTTKWIAFCLDAGKPQSRLRTNFF